MILEVRYNEKEKVGTLAENSSNGLIFFEYDGEWLEKKCELSPVSLPLAVGTIPQAHHELSFQGLHGLFWDSLPDSWGRAVLEERLRRQGIDLEKLSPLLQLSYLGSRGMGALSYFPDTDPEQNKILEAVSLASMDREASFILEGKPIEGKAEEILALFESGCSAGGAKPKVLISLRDADLHLGPHIKSGWEGWIIKLSNVPTEHKDSKEEGRMEYAYALMARAAALDVPPSRLFEIESKKNKRGLFGVKRFDRNGSEKIHFHSLAGLLQRDFRLLETTYEELATATLTLTENFSHLEEIIRRLVFNTLAGNCDDHAKNHGFLMNDQGRWHLAPAFDLTASAGMNKINQHAMSVNGTRSPGLKDFKIFAKNFGLPLTSLEKILEEVRSSIQRWPEWAEQAGCRTANIKKGKEHLQKSCL